jgi:HlyD family secretion protein
MLSGYVEGEPLYLAAPASGAVAAVYVREGERVAAGRPVFLIDPGVQRAQESQAAAAVEAARARAEDLRKGQRAPELEVFDAELAAAQAQAREAEAEYARIAPARAARHLRPGAARPGAGRARHRTGAGEAVRRRRQVGDAGRPRGRHRRRRGPGRPGAGQPGRGAHPHARPGAPGPPVEARVEEVFFRPGEWAAANQPIVSLLPDGEVKLRFLRPRARRGALPPGGKVRFTCDSCGGPRDAVITWVSPRPSSPRRSSTAGVARPAGVPGRGGAGPIPAP